MDTAAHEEVGFDRHLPRLYRFYEIVQDLVGDRFMECAFVPIAPEIEFEALELHAEFIRHITNTDRREIRLAGLRAKARKFRTIHLNIIIPFGIRILEDLEFF